MYIKVASSQQRSVMGIGRPNSSFIHFTFTEDKEVLSKLDLTLVCCACVWRGGVWRLGPAGVTLTVGRHWVML